MGSRFQNFKNPEVRETGREKKTMERFTWICCIPLVLLLFALDPGMASIDCYVCNSHNYSEPMCDDPMSPAFMQLKENCMVAKETYTGCILTCNFDGCNAAVHLIHVSNIFILI